MGKKAEQFNRLRTGDLRHSWTHPVGHAVVDFFIRPHINRSASDLLINGKAFFSYLYSVDEEYPLGVSKSGYDVLLYFRIPAHSTQGKTRLESTFGSKSGFQQVDFPFATKQCLPDPKGQFTEHSRPSDDYRQLDDEYEFSIPNGFPYVLRERYSRVFRTIYEESSSHL